METRVALIGILIDDPDAVEKVNQILHQSSRWIVGRMGIPYHARNINIISVVVDAPQDEISRMSGLIGKLSGVTAKIAYAKLPNHTSAKLWTAYILPPPERVWETFLIMIQNGQLVEHAALSLMRVFIGFSCAFLLAAFLVTLSLLLPFFRKMNHGLLVFIQHIPPLSLIPLLVLWFGIGETPKFLIIILATFFPIYLNMEDGLLRADPKLLEVGKTLGFSQRETLWKIRLPLALPTIVTGMRIGMGYSLRSIIGAEMIAADRGLGYFILDAQTMSRSDKVIVGILAIGLIGFFLDGLFSLFSYVLFPYERRNS